MHDDKLASTHTRSHSHCNDFPMLELTTVQGSVLRDPEGPLLLKSFPVLVLARCVRARYVFRGDLCGISAG